MYFFYFYPLGLDGRTTRYPLATRALTVVMLVAFAWLHYRPDLLTVDPRNLIFYPGNGAPWTALSAPAPARRVGPSGGKSHLLQTFSAHLWRTAWARRCSCWSS